MTSKFEKSNPFHKHSTYICDACGKRTRETGQSESGVGLCAKCFEESGLENEHSDDGHPEYIEKCPTCRLLKAQEEKKMETQTEIAKKSPANWRELPEIEVKTTEKKCGKCQAIRPAKDFWKMRTSRDGLQPQCKYCQLGTTPPEAPKVEEVVPMAPPVFKDAPKKKAKVVSLDKPAKSDKKDKAPRKSRAKPIGSGKRKECKTCQYLSINTDGTRELCISTAAVSNSQDDSGKPCQYRVAKKE